MYPVLVGNRLAIFQAEPINNYNESTRNRTKNGLKQVCKDGPVFDLEDGNWRDLENLDVILQAPAETVCSQRKWD